MDFIKKAECVLWYYRNLSDSIQNLQEQIDRIVRSQLPKELKSSADYEEDIHYHKAHATEKTFADLKSLIDYKKESESVVKSIDEILQGISKESGCEHYGQVLKLWYIEKWPKEDIANEVGYQNRRDIYRIRDKAIKKFAVSVYGVQALKDVLKEVA